MDRRCRFYGDGLHIEHDKSNSGMTEHLVVLHEPVDFLPASHLLVRLVLLVRIRRGRIGGEKRKCFLSVQLCDDFL